MQKQHDSSDQSGTFIEWFTNEGFHILYAIVKGTELFIATFSYTWVYNL